MSLYDFQCCQGCRVNDECRTCEFAPVVPRRRDIDIEHTRQAASAAFAQLAKQALTEGANSALTMVETGLAHGLSVEAAIDVARQGTQVWGSAMKRVALMRRSPLRSRPKHVTRTAAEFAWKDGNRGGYCQCGCSRFSLRLERHAILERSWLIQNGFEKHQWDQANSMLLHPLCHARHTNAFRRIPLEAIPEAALAFALDLLGEDRAAMEIARRCGTQVSFRRAA